MGFFIKRRRLQVSIILVGQGLLGSRIHLRLVLLEQGLVHRHLRGRESRGGDKLQGRIANQLAGEPQERLLKVVVGLGRDVVVLEVLLAVEGDGLGFDLPFLHVHLVPGKDDWDVLAYADEIAMPVGDVLVRDPRCDVKHDDAALPVDVVAVAETTKLLLAGSIPHIELEFAEVGEEAKRVNLNTQSGNIFFFKLSSQVTLDESGLASSTIANQDQLEGGDA